LSKSRRFFTLAQIIWHYSALDVGRPGWPTFSMAQ
jgi:hypothetical protein